MATVPDFGGLASAQKNANDQATNQTNLANRPNQYNPMGSVTWGQDPSGNWTQTTALNPTEQNLYWSTLGGQQNLSGQIGAGLDYGNLPAMPQVGQYNQQVIDAWNALQAPDLAKSEDAQRARLAAQGITNGSAISSISDRNLGNIRTDAGNKAILAGYQQGNTEYDQALRARQQGASEAQNKYSAAISGSGALTSARNSLNPNEWAAKVPTSAAYLPTTIYGAAQDTFNANRQNENADTAQRNSNINAGVGLASSLLGSSGAMGGIGSLVGGAWNWGNDLYNGWNADNWFSAGDAGNWGGNWTPGESFI